MTKDVFTPDPEDTVDETIIPKFEDLVGDGKKYKDTEAAAKAIFEKDRFIARLLEEKREVEAALNARNNEDEFLTRMERLVQRPQPEPQRDTTPDDKAREAALDPAKIEQLVEQKLTEAQKKARGEANLNEVTRKLEETYGPNYKTRVATHAQQLGVGTQWLTDLAAENPTAFYRVMGLDQQKQVDVFTPPPASSQNTTSVRPGVKNYAYYQDLRRKNGESWYFSGEVQREIWEQAKAQGGSPEERSGFYKR